MSSLPILSAMGTYMVSPDVASERDHVPSINLLADVLCWFTFLLGTSDSI